MITKKDLIKISKEKNMNLGQTEKNYMHTLFLYFLSKYFPNNLIFKGGTALMICYNLDRFSEYLDFTLTKQINLNELLKQSKIFFNKYSYELEYKILNETNNSQSYIIFIKGPLYMGKPESLCRIELDFSHRDDLLLKPVMKKVYHIFDDFQQFYINVLSLNEILAEKIRCIFTRDKARDIYDLHYLIQRNIQLNEKLINQKLKIYDLKYNKKKFISLLKNKEKIWKNEMQYLIKIVPEFNTILEEIQSKL
ncbi:MAG: nucleotidyl transferase AbiEii/AbiGii toxin family protein [Nanoarchaeota archaeon]